MRCVIARRSDRRGRRLPHACGHDRRKLDVAHCIVPTERPIGIVVGGHLHSFYVWGVEPQHSTDLAPTGNYGRRVALILGGLDGLQKALDDVFPLSC